MLTSRGGEAGDFAFFSDASKQRVDQGMQFDMYTQAETVLGTIDSTGDDHAGALHRNDGRPRRRPAPRPLSRPWRRRRIAVRWTPRKSRI